jgi:hypothetical protein
MLALLLYPIGPARDFRAVAAGEMRMAVALKLWEHTRAELDRSEIVLAIQYVKRGS